MSAIMPYWFAVNANETVGKTTGLSAAAVGCWLLLRCYLMSHERVPKSPIVVQRICRGADNLDILDALSLLIESEDGYRCPEIMAIRQKMQSTSKARSEAGKKGAKAKWDKIQQEDMGWMTH